MPEVAIVVDTTHYMPHALVEANGLHEVSLYVNAGDRHERESDMPDFDAFYESLRQRLAPRMQSDEPALELARRQLTQQRDLIRR